MPEHIMRFESWEAMVAQSQVNTGGKDAPSRNSDKLFRGTETFDKAIKLALHGWPEGREHIRHKFEVLYSSLPSKRSRRELVYARRGPGTLDMGRYIQGYPEPYVIWRDTLDAEEGQAKGSIVPVTFNISASAKVSTNAMFEKGAIVCALVDLLERSNRRVELTLAMRVTMEDFGITITSIIKRAQDSLDLDRITFSIAHASCFRRLGFSLLEQAPTQYLVELGIRPGGGYGFPRDLNPLPDGIYIKASSLYERGYSEARQIKWLREQLTQVGVELEE